jgi:hypothetical protein
MDSRVAASARDALQAGDWGQAPGLALPPAALALGSRRVGDAHRLLRVMSFHRLRVLAAKRLHERLSCFQLDLSSRRAISSSNSSGVGGSFFISAFENVMVGGAVGCCRGCPRLVWN